MTSATSVAERPWAVEASDVADALEVNPLTGLGWAEAAARLDRVGSNELLETPPTPVWRLALAQFSNAMIVVLLVASVITALIGDLEDTVVILAIVLINAVIGFVQEYRAEEAMSALKRMTGPSAHVVRDGEIRTIPAAEVVPGDVLRLEAGDVVTADARLLEAKALRINEAALTGESEPAAKGTGPLPDVTAALLADQRNMVFSGTAVTHGRGTGVVVATGMRTALGNVAQLLQEGSGDQTPLQRRLGRLGKVVALAALAICAVVFVLGVARGEPPETMFLTAVSLAVAAIPEGLPAVVTVALALGARRMARRRSLVRKLPAVETLGSVTVVCTDKTGTLTENQMLVEHVWTPATTFRVEGVGYEPEGVVAPVGGRSGDLGDLADLAWVAAACNDASLIAPSVAGESWMISGDPTEAALLVLAAKTGVWSADVHERTPRIDEITFDAERRRMTTIHRDPSGGVRVAVKGALEAVAPLTAADQVGVVTEAVVVEADLARRGYRVLALADRRIDGHPGPAVSAEADLRLLGLAAMADPPRRASAPSVEACRQAGVTPVMITGDHPTTARAIAERLGIGGDGTLLVTGAELEAMDDAAFAGEVANIGVYARTNPEQKLRIVRAWQEQGAVVAMTGDGVNDAPALRQADIGVAMGVMGTEVSKEAADMVLADDDFATIVAAIEEGRRIYDNIRRFVRYLLTTNSAELWVMVLAPLLGLPLPLLAVQILWINLVTDGLPALALGVEPAEPDTMRRPPRPPTESIFARGLWQHAIWVGLWMAAVTLAVQAAAIAEGWQWQTMVFTTLALLQLGHALAIRSERLSLFTLGLRSNLSLTLAVAGTVVVQLALVYVPTLRPVFGTEPLPPPQLALVLLCSTLGFAAVEIEKAVGRVRQRQESHDAEGR